MEHRFVIAGDKDRNWNKKNRLWMVTERWVCWNCSVFWLHERHRNIHRRKIHIIKYKQELILITNWIRYTCMRNLTSVGCWASFQQGFNWERKDPSWCSATVKGPPRLDLQTAWYTLLFKVAVVRCSAKDPETAQSKVHKLLDWNVGQLCGETLFSGFQDWGSIPRARAWVAILRENMLLNQWDATELQMLRPLITKDWMNILSPEY